ncbi:MAG: hypothetical protein AAFQ63_15690 [Cyanobacteria bacterium J06621_11]
MRKAKPKTPGAKTNIPQLTVAMLGEELNISPDLFQAHWPALTAETVIDRDLEARIRYWANNLYLSPAQQELRRLLAQRLMACDYQESALNEIDRLLSVAEASNGKDLPTDPTTRAFIKEIWQAEKKLQHRMGGMLDHPVEGVYIGADGNIVRPIISISPTETKQSVSPALLETSETPPALPSSEN